VRKFADYAREMIPDLGEAARPLPALVEMRGRITAYSASKYVIMSARLPLATTQGCSNSARCIHEPSL
jgi:hypothetical protein